MEAISTISSSVEIKQHNSITAKQSSLELCKNRKVMPLKDLLASITKKLMSYAMMLTGNNEDDAWDLIQSTIEKLIKNKEILDHIEEIFKKYVTTPINEQNRKQALLPSKAKIFKFDHSFRLFVDQCHCSKTLSFLNAEDLIGLFKKKSNSFKLFQV